MDRMAARAWRRLADNNPRSARPFCKCFYASKPTSLESGACKCGEHTNVFEWKWANPRETEASWMILTCDKRQVTFHPYYSSGTAMVRGDTALVRDYHYYWEIKMLTEPYGTDIMIGVGTEKVDPATARYRFTSLLGQDAESYGLSYTGAVRHDDRLDRDGIAFCKGSIIGVKVDLWQGTLEFFINRKSRGISFFNLRRHPSQTLYPMISSTAAQSSMRLIYAGSWQSSLLVDAAKILGTSFEGDLPLPPGLKNKMKNHFWLTLPNESCVVDERGDESQGESSGADYKGEASNIPHPPDFPYMYNGYYADNIDMNFRIAIANDVTEDNNHSVFR